MEGESHVTGRYIGGETFITSEVCTGENISLRQRGKGHEKPMYEVGETSSKKGKSTA